MAKQPLLAAKTVRILPTRFADNAGAKISEKNRNLVANAIDRSMCRRLSKRFEVVSSIEPADLSVQATITHVGTTSRIAAGASTVLGFIPSAFSSIPLLSPRIPIGLGSLTVEAEALDRIGTQNAVLIWARGADSFRSSARVSEVGDAYELAGAFSDTFSQLLINGEKPSGRLKLPELPKLRGSNKDADCDLYGNNPGILGRISDNFGLPPGLTDKGPQASRAPKPTSREQDVILTDHGAPQRH